MAAIPRIDAMAAARLVIQILAVTAIAWVIANSVLLFLAGPRDTGTRAVAADASAPAVAFSADQIAAWRLFGRADTGPRAAAATERLAETRLSLVLVGVFSADEAGASAALIAQPNRKARRYRIGDRLPGLATLEAVYRDRVVIRRAGNRELIRFPEPKAPFVADSPASPVAEGAPREARGAEPANPAPAARRRDASLAARLGEELGRDAGELLREVGMTAVRDGAAEGYTVGALASNPVLRQAGLQPGDRILSVNGRAVGDIDRDRLELADLASSGSARLEVQRGARRWYVTLSLN